MCLAFISSRYLRLRLYCEHIFLSIERGAIRPREVYDVFFRLDSRWQNPLVFLISPHDLLGDDGVLAVKASPAPGSGTENDIAYVGVEGRAYHFDRGTGEFRVEMPITETAWSPPGEQHFCGRVLTPQIRVPQNIDTEVARDIMAERGTVLEMSLGDCLEPGDYAFRLVVENHKLLGIGSARSMDLELPGTVRANWVQQAYVNCPRNCRYNVRQLLLPSSGDPSEKEALASIGAIVEAQNLRTALPEFYRLLVVVPDTADIASQGCQGAIHACQPGFILPDGRLGGHWQGGSQMYWQEDPFSVAKKAYDYLNNYAGRDPKRKEDVTTALGLLHGNCSLVVDAMERHGLIECVAPNQYKARNVTPAALTAKCEAIACDSVVENGYKFRGHIVTFNIRFSHVRPEDREKMEKAQARQDRTYNLSHWGFWVTAAGIVLSIVALIVALTR